MSKRNFFNPYGMFEGCFIPNCLMEYTELSSNDKLIWARLVQHAGREGVCYPKQTLLAEETGLSEKTIYTSIRHLEEEGFIFVEASTGSDRFTKRNNNYYFIRHKIFNEYGDVNFTSPEQYGLRPQINKTNIVKDKKEKYKKEKDFLELFPKNFQQDEDFTSTWCDFIADRKARRKAVTPIAAKRLAKKLLDFSSKKTSVAMEILQRSIDNSWTDIYELKSNTSSSKQVKIIKHGDKPRNSKYEYVDLDA